jgi:microcin C transport system permease protein
MLLSIPTLLGISVLCFLLVHIVPGGPVEQALAQWRQSATGGEAGGGQTLQVTEEQRRLLMAYYGFDKPLPIRYLEWLGKLIRLDFGESYFYEEPVWNVISSRLPVSVTFGLASFLLSYLICIPLGILKAIKHNSLFDAITSALLFFLYSVPPFALGILLIVLFCTNQFWNIFPIEGFHSTQFEELSFVDRLFDIAHHMFLPLLCYTIGSFALLTMLMKNSLLEQLKQDYITTARAKGLSEKMVILKHALRNAILPIASGFGHFLSFFFAGALLIEVIFNLQGIGRLSYESVINRDFPVVLANIMILSVLNIVGNILSDFLYVVIDPRIDFS